MLETNSFELYELLEAEISKEIMSKTMPDMSSWKKKTSKGKIDKTKNMTVKTLKIILNKAIDVYLSDKWPIKKISNSVFEMSILEAFYHLDLSGFKIKLNKNGKTVNVKKFSEYDKIKINEKMKSSELYEKELKPWVTSFKPFSKASKEIIMEGKLQQVVSFHLIRKHNSKWEKCIACKAVRAFVQWEFHQSPMKKDKLKMMIKVQSKITKEAAQFLDKKPAMTEMKITVGPNQYVKESMYEQYQKWIGNDDIITDPITGIKSISHDPLKDLLVDDLDSLKNEDAFELNAEGLDDGFDG